MTFIPSLAKYVIVKSLFGGYDALRPLPPDFVLPKSMLQEFKQWLKTKPDSEAFDFWSVDSCPLAQFGKFFLAQQNLLNEEVGVRGSIMGFYCFEKGGVGWGRLFRVLEEDLIPHRNSNFGELKKVFEL